MTLEAVSRVSVPAECVASAYEHLRTAGDSGVEGVALWAGRLDGYDFRVTRAVIPRQRALRLPSGLMYVVDDEELHRINVELYRDHLTLVAQLHSHPADAYHSETDDAYPIVTSLGSISIVVPDFARGEIEPATWAVYRLHDPGWWPVSQEDVRRLIRIEEE